MKRGIILSFILLQAMSMMGAEGEFLWRNLGRPTWGDAVLPGRVNVSEQAVQSESGGLHPLLWSVSNVASPTPRECVYDPVYRANTSLNAGWNSATAGAVDPVNPFLQFDFPAEKPVEVDTLIFWSRVPDTPEFRTFFVVERRLGNEWKIIFSPRERRDAEAAIIRFDRPFPAHAIRVRFLAPAASSYLLMRRFWIYTPENSSCRWFAGGRMDLFVSDRAKQENEIVFSPENDVSFLAVFTPAAGSWFPRSRLDFEITDYYGEALPGKRLAFPVSTADCGSFSLRFAGMKPGPYYLKWSLRSGDSLLLQGRKLFGIQGDTPAPAALRDLPALSRPRFEFAGGIGQNCGPGQRFSNTVLDAYGRLGVNTIQLEPLWRDIEPLPGVYNFAELDRMFLKAAEAGYFLGISLYATDGNLPPFLHQRQYAMLDHYGRPAVGRTEWFMLIEGPPSSHAPIFRKHYFEVWRKIVERYAPSRRVLRYDLRPSLCERFYFDDFVNAFRGSDGVCDFSEWARRDYIAYLRDFRKFSLAEVSERSGMKFASWEEIQFPRPRKGYRAQQSDRRSCWLDFCDFKNRYHPAEFFLPTVRMAAAADPDAQIFLRFHSYFYEELLKEKRLAGGYFSMENGTLFFALRSASPVRRCFEWGDPAPNYTQFNAGLFNLLPQMRGNSLRWVYNPMLGEERFNEPRYWKSFESLCRLAPHLEELSDYVLPHSKTALFGGFDQEFGRTDTARPVRYAVRPDQFGRFHGGDFGGLYAVLFDGLFKAGMLPLEDFGNPSPEFPPELVIDGGNPDVPERDVRRLLEFVHSGGKAIVWSNSCRFDGSKAGDLLRRSLEIQGDFTTVQKDGSFRFEPDSQTHFEGRLTGAFDKTTPLHGRVVGWSGTTPAAWLISYGRGTVCYINGLPKTVKQDDWRKFLDWALTWACQKRYCRVSPSDNGVTGYALHGPDRRRMLVIFNNGPDVDTCEVHFPHALDKDVTYEFSLLHCTEKESGLSAVRRDGEAAILTLTLKSRDLMIVRATPGEMPKK